MAQDTMNIALPENLKEFVLRQVAEGGYSTTSEYVRELIRADQKRKAGQRLETLLLAGLEGRDSTPMTQKEWNSIRAQVNARLK
ncbi:MAG: type II toxin-antitoxin system ParD family antitoxin [Planctomycetia bacterium]|nr:type II toxin-antitoxin system ParD family antitoxin [Planctomycetia bacterium]